jgi:hypothetical protein
LVADVVNKLKAIRGPGQSFSDVILTLANGEGAAKRTSNPFAQTLAQVQNARQATAASSRQSQRAPNAGRRAYRQ